MAVRLLDNARWGFDSNCYVCEPSNDRGLRIPFSYDDGAGVVSAQFVLGGEYSGAPKLVHGGVILAVLDEAVAWAAIAGAGRFAVVHRTSTTFHHGVEVGRRYKVEATIEDYDERTIHARAAVVDLERHGRRCAETEASLVVMSPTVATATIGQVPPADGGYLREQDL